MLKYGAYAKINLALDILFKRPDGYHEVAMVMQSISLADSVSLMRRRAGIKVSVDIAGLPVDSKNLVYRAAALLKQHTQTGQGVHIHLEKKIPIAAGLAGGSADAAAVLKGLNELWRLNLSLDELSVLAARLGSDVPFCLYNGTMLATGRGEQLTDLPPLPPCYVVLGKPSVHVSTAWVYRQYKTGQIKAHPDIAAMRACLAEKSLAGVADRMANVLESVTIQAYPEIAGIKEAMIKYGAMASLMSGSGPTVFGLTDCLDKAQRIADQLKLQGIPQVFVAETVAKVE